MRYILNSGSNSIKIVSNRGNELGELVDGTFIGKLKYFKLARRALGSHIVERYVSPQELAALHKQVQELMAGQDGPEGVETE